MRLQLALASLLQSLLPGLQQPPQLYDPAFSELDHQLLEAMGMQVIDHNEQGSRPVQQPTLFYMPHCEVSSGETVVAVVILLFYHFMVAAIG